MICKANHRVEEMNADKKAVDGQIIVSKARKGTSLKNSKVIQTRGPTASSQL
jgi:hypothetical protein